MSLPRLTVVVPSAVVIDDPQRCWCAIHGDVWGQPGEPCPVCRVNPPARYDTRIGDGTQQPRTQSKAARREAGRVRVDVWLPPDTAKRLDKLAHDAGTRTAAIVDAIDAAAGLKCKP